MPSRAGGSRIPESVPRIQADDASRFLVQLERMLYRRRLRRSCIGFIPTAWALYDEINAWEAAGFEEPFLWQSGEAHIHRAITYNSAVRDYFSLQGVSLEMNRFLWDKIAYQDDIQFATISGSTRIDVKGSFPESKQVMISVRPLPEVAYNVVVSWPGPPGDLAKKARSKANKPATKRVLYTTRDRQVGDMRSSILLPAEYFLGEETDPADKGVATTLLPRHFLTPVPPIALDKIAEIPQANQPSIEKRRLATERGVEECLVFSGSAILNEIRASFARNWYGDRFFEICDWQGELLRQVIVAERPDQIGWLAMFQRLGPDAPTFSYIEKADYARSDRPADVSKRIENVCRLRTPVEFGPDEGFTHNVGAVPYDSEIDFDNLLKNVDADFLLLGLDSSVRGALDAAADQWAEETRKIVEAEYWLGGCLRKSRVKAHLLSDVRSVFDARDDEVQSICQDALRAFSTNRKLVIRTALETMQRLALQGLRPQCVTIETRSATLARWRSLLKKTLNARLKSSEKGLPTTALEHVHEFSEERLPTDADESAEYESEVREIQEVLEMLQEIGPEERLLEEFFELACSAGEAAWDDAITSVAKEQSYDEFKAVVERAIQACHGAENGGRSVQLSPVLRERLRELFKK